MIRRPPSSTLFPSTTLSRSGRPHRPPAAGRGPRAFPAKSHRSVLQRLAEKSDRSEEHTSELQSHLNLVCRLLLEKKNGIKYLSKMNLMSGIMLVPSAEYSSY